MFDDLCILIFNGFSKFICTIYLFHTYYEMFQETQSVYLMHKSFVSMALPTGIGGDNDVSLFRALE